MKTISPIALDMGAKYTGVYLSQYQQGDTPECAEKTGMVVMHSDAMTYSQVDRTARRHQSRTAKRRKMAKRLLWLLLDKCYQIQFHSLGRTEREAINSLLNRRGFTYLSENVDEALLAVLPAEPYALYYHADLPRTGNLLEAYQVITSVVDTAKAFKNSEQYSLNAKEFEKVLPDDYKENKKQLSNGLKALRQGVDSFIKAELDGHKIRSAYLDNIRADIVNHADYQFLRDLLPVPPEQFANLVGHISNMQLRVLRRYFNDEAMKTNDIWLPEKLHKVFYRNLSAFHCKTELDKANQIALFEKRSIPILTLFETVVPALSIPPFEDQNNRRPPKCQSLLISVDAMEAHLPLWSAIVSKLADELERQGVVVKKGLELANIQNKEAWAQVLQRILELSRAHDPFQLRAWIAKEEKSGEFIQRSKDALGRVIQGQALESFIQFAIKFYQETADARHALWFEAPGRILKVCGQKPPHKANQLRELLSGAFSHNLTEGQEESFKYLWRENPRIGRRGIKGWCQLAAESQKEFGNALNHHIQRNVWLKEQGKKVEDKNLIEISEVVPKVAESIAKQLGIPAQRFSNVFDLAKLYNLMEQDQKGFSRNCRSCTKENNWRGEIVPDREDNEAAVGLRLPADTTRPFDGLLARLLDKQAYQIALAKIQQLPKEKQEEGISIPIIVEENRFRFTASLSEIKRNAKSKNDNLKRAERAEAQWLDKDERIKVASKGICPYTGEVLELGGEIDHIIPRAESKGRNKGVFNHEANLIYCSSTGNSTKDRSFYTLQNLHPAYLETQFGHSDRDAIKQELIRLCSAFIEKGSLISFTEIEAPELRQAIRHGLFVEELRFDLMRLLYQSTKTRVNGTQAYLAKLIMQKIRQNYTVNTVDFSVGYIEAEKGQSQRSRLAEKHPQFAKVEYQPVASHMVDAAMVMAEALRQPHTRDMLQTAGLDDSDWLFSILPKEAQIKRIEPKLKFEKASVQSQRLFKDGLYAEHFIPLIVTQDKLGVGFNNRNVIWVDGQAQAHELWWQALRPYLNGARDKTIYDVKQQAGTSFKAYSINKPAAFELLHRVAKENCSDEDHLAADLLESLHYATQKVSLRSALFNDQTKTFTANSKLLDEKGFSIKVEVKSRFLKAKQRKLDGKQLQYPGRHQWLKLTEHEFVCQNQGRKLGKEEFFDESGYQSMLEELFPRHITNTRQHKKVRKEWSLPKIDSPSGGYRVKRKNADKSDVWQLFGVEGLSASGFKRSGEEIDFSEDVPIQGIEQSRNLIAVGSRHQVKADAECFNNWRKVPAELLGDVPVQGLMLSPNSKSRFRHRVFVSVKDFMENVIPLVQGGEEIKHWSQLPAEIKLITPKSWLELFGDLFGKPRSNLFVTQVGDVVSLEYIVESSNKAMRQVYQLGEPV
ncbi:type II-B CRISPR-associated RNA-guided endonuclease Cas9/Csx12 [Vibrio sp. JC009]|uniref:type II-B CRISPR-associated RNA-guided endonuclease Cas9/Csx12 n=1 Tax=Vibrio sp. JC009 TaxID=2912314 RepID=UPI0023AFE108|nr:type II-B CRISPR-associated RNA-guided endonuclease Cas9/Csx12 [Vibrio sp. JC009]WED21081.1 type II-B CRISPR-associated RNA-guided endonuclease Cas9/Csx12 [Vibrio sp. JC009]